MFCGGEVLDHTYEIIEEIGTGGTGIVYRAYHMRLKKYVVVKKLKNAVIDRNKMRVEVDILKKLHHTYLPQVYDFLEIEGQVYTIMDYIEGKDLQYYLDSGYVFGEKQLIFWLKQLCEVLEYLHSQKPPILHSDIKPGNIMITPEGNVCLIDFNISLGGENGSDILGLSQWYAAPEQSEKARLRMEHLDGSRIILDGRMDIYSLGASFYSLMSGRLPDIFSPDFLPLRYLDTGYSSALVGIIERSMEESPEKRYSDASSMRKALDDMYKMDAGYKKLQKQNWILWGISGMCVAAGILSCIYGLQTISMESYNTEYARFYEGIQKYEDERTISAGIQILNENKYQDILDKNPEDKAQILYAVGNAYYGQEDYEAAEEYYQEAAEIFPDSVYYRDQVMAAVKAGNLPKAKRALKEAERAGIRDEEIRLAQQETAFAEGNTELVIQIAEELKDSKSEEIAGYSSLLGAKAYGAENRYDKQAEYLEYAYKLGKDKRCLRELGSTFLEMADNARGTVQNEYLKKAKECYKQLQKTYAASYRDQMNLAVIRERLGEYQESEKILKNLAKNYPQEYEIYMHLAYVCLKQQEAVKEENRDYTQTVDYYRKAEQRYRKAGSPEDSAMWELSEYIKGLEEEQQ